MPYRYYRFGQIEDLFVAYRLHRVAHGLTALTDDWTIAPFTQQPVITRHPITAERELSLMRWAIPHDAATPGPLGSNPLLQAEDIQPAELERRCLVPNSGYWQWQHRDGQRTLFRIEPAYDELQCFAGIWQESHDPHTGQLLHSFAIVTCPANDLVATVHPRMPVILQGSELERWLSPDTTDIPDLLVAPDPEFMDVCEAFPTGGVLRAGYPTPEELE